MIPRWVLVTAAAASLAVLGAGCGSSGSSSAPSSASSTETWANGVCSSISTWEASVTLSVESLKSDLSSSGLQTAVDEAKTATETLATSLEGLGAPQTASGQQAKDALDQLSTDVRQDISTIEGATDGVSGASGLASAGATVASTLATMGTQVQTTLSELKGLDSASSELKDAFATAGACEQLTDDGG
jgi:hypothetical protein